MKTRQYLQSIAVASAITLATLAAPAVQAAPSQFHHVVNVDTMDALNLRAGPGTNNAVLATIPHNGRTIVSTGRTDGNWTEVEWAGQTGWVGSRYLQVTNIQAAPAAVPAARSARTNARAPRQTGRNASVSHNHPANSCTNSVTHSHPNGGAQHEHSYACQPGQATLDTSQMIKPKFKPKYQQYATQDLAIQY